MKQLGSPPSAISHYTLSSVASPGWTSKVIVNSCRLVESTHVLVSLGAREGGECLDLDPWNQWRWQQKGLGNSNLSWWKQICNLCGPKAPYLENSSQCGHFCILWGLPNVWTMEEKCSHPTTQIIRAATLACDIHHDPELRSFFLRWALAFTNLSIYTVSLKDGNILNYQTLGSKSCILCQ